MWVPNQETDLSLPSTAEVYIGNYILLLYHLDY